MASFDTLLGKNGQLGSRGQILNHTVAQDDRVFYFSAADAGIPREGLIVEHDLSPIRSRDPLALTIPGGASLMMEPLLSGETFSGISCLRGLKQCRGGCSGSRGVQQLCIDTRSRLESLDKI